MYGMKGNLSLGVQKQNLLLDFFFLNWFNLLLTFILSLTLRTMPGGGGWGCYCVTY